MLRPNVTVQMVADHVDEIFAAIHKLADVQVLVGVPATKNARKDGPIGNAALAYIHEHGSPLRNIPPRPFLVPGIKDAEPVIAKRLDAAARAALAGDKATMMQQLNAAGMSAANSVQRKITEGPFTPLAPATLARRRARLRGTTALTSAQRRQGFADIRPLIDTGQLRAAITYVVRERGRNVGGKP